MQYVTAHVCTREVMYDKIEKIKRKREEKEEEEEEEEEKIQREKINLFHKQSQSIKIRKPP